MADCCTRSMKWAESQGKEGLLGRWDTTGRLRAGVSLIVGIHFAAGSSFGHSANHTAAVECQSWRRLREQFVERSVVIARMRVDGFV